MQVKKLTSWLAALSVLAVAAIACTSSSSDPTPPPTSTATPTATAIATAVPGDQPTPTAQAGATSPANTPSDIPPELASFLADVDRKMAEIRGIPVAEPVPYRFLNDQELNAYVREQIDDPEVVEDIGNSDALYKLLGLISTNAVLFDEYASLLDAQVLGAYDPEEEEFVVLQPGAEFGPSQEFTYAHEYIHRLQDARYGLDEITERLKENSDRSLAFTALVEGDATTAQQRYALRHLDFTQLSQILAESQAAVADSPEAPYILQRGLEFPYLEGATFVNRLRTTQGPESLELAFQEPPDSTEQILHIEKFVNRELPDEVVLPATLFDPAGPVGDGWEVLDENVFGEFFLKSWLQAIGARTTDAAEAAAGWGGDAVTLAVNDSGDHAVAAKIVWDDQSQDAEQFFIVLTTVMAASPEFLRVDVSANVGVKAYEGDGGVIVVATLSNLESGNFTAIAAAVTIDDAMLLVLALAG